MEIIWKDKKKDRYFVLFGNLFVASLLALYLKENFFIESYFRIFLQIFLIVVALFFSFNALRLKLIYMNKEGIWIGNSKDGKYQSFQMQKTHFLKWSDIISIRIKGKVTRRPTYAGLVNMIEVKCKNGKKYECFIAQPKNFVKALKKLKKNHLFAKDSKYLELLKKNE